MILMRNTNGLPALAEGISPADSFPINAHTLLS